MKDGTQRHVAPLAGLQREWRARQYLPGPSEEEAIYPASR
jgi:hypothetical protein